MNADNGRSVLAVTDWFLLRAPAYSQSDLLAWTKDLKAPSCGQDIDPLVLEHAAEADWNLLAGRLRDHVREPAFREALLLASPSLEQELDAWLTSIEGPGTRRVTLSVAKYFVRSRARATPFGLFSACSFGTVGSGPTRLHLAGPLRRRSRLDGACLVRLCRALLADPKVRRRTCFRTNPTVHFVGERIHYIDASLADGVYQYTLNFAPSSQAVLIVVEAALQGCSYANLQGLLEEQGITPDDAQEYLDQLVDAQVLLSELEPSLNSADPAQELIAELRSAQLEQHAQLLSATAGLVRTLDRDNAPRPASDYRAIAQSLSTFGITMPPGAMLQVDAFRESVSANLSADVVNEVLRGASLLYRIAPAADPLRAFREAFRNRYEAEEVPLLEALDDEIGVGFVEPQLSEGKPGVIATQRMGALIARGACAVEHEVQLTDNDIRALSHNDPSEVPATFGVEAAISAASEAALDRGDFRVLVGSAFGPSGATLMGRFCHLDPMLQAAVQRHLKDEEGAREEADTIFAEVFHLPGEKLGNISCRPAMRAHAIPVFARLGPGVTSLPLNDLLLSVVRGGLVLRSRRLGKRVVPRITTAQNFGHHSNIPLFRLLGLMQKEGTRAGAMWSWGHLEGTPFLPRVAWGRIVLRCAEWYVSLDDLPRHSSLGGRYAALRKWHRENRLPRHLLIKQDGQTLPVDFDAITSVEICWDMLRRHKMIRLVENFPSYETHIGTAKGRPVVTHLVIPFTRSPAGGRSERSRALASGVVRRRFSPGSEWLYAKVFGGPATTDRFLREELTNWLKDLTSDGTISRWFFVRYSDPSPHIRIRACGDPQALSSDVVPALHARVQAAIECRRLGSMQLDTYVREVERYGGATAIEFAEEAFHADSIASIELLNAFDSAGWQAVRLAVCAHSVDQVSTDFGWNVEQRRTFYRAVSSRSARDDRQEHSRLYREHRRPIEHLLMGAETDAVLQVVREPLARRSERLAAIVRPWTAALEDKTDLPDIVRSVMHMHVNRLGMGAEESTVFGLLSKALESLAARTNRIQGIAHG